MLELKILTVCHVVHLCWLCLLACEGSEDRPFVGCWAAGRRHTVARHRQGQVLREMEPCCPWPPDRAKNRTHRCREPGTGRRVPFRPLGHRWLGEVDAPPAAGRRPFPLGSSSSQMRCRLPPSCSSHSLRCAAA